MPNSEALLLLDTHIWIWLMNGDEKLASPRLLKIIQERSDRKALRVSVISVWEVGMLESKKRIMLPYSCHEWVHRALNIPGLALVPLGADIALESTRLPDTFHGDPADRILVATAAHLGAELVTQDERIHAYLKKNPIVHAIAP